MYTDRCNSDLSPSINAHTYATSHLILVVSVTMPLAAVSLSVLMECNIKSVLRFEMIAS